MSAEYLLERFGYLAVFVGTFLEGETLLLLGGFFAEQGYLMLPVVVLAAFAGSMSGHMLWFWLGRSRGVGILERYPRASKHCGKGIRLFEKYGAATILVSQYLYGVRISCAIIVGMSRIPLYKFVTYIAISCLSWSIVIALLGYYFGAAVGTILGKAAHAEKYGLIGLLLIAGLVWLYHRNKDKKEEAIIERK